MILTQDTINFLNKVRREGDFIARYDKETVIDNTILYDDTHSVFIYHYKDENNTLRKVIIIMEHGEYIDYYVGGITQIERKRFKND